MTGPDAQPSGADPARPGLPRFAVGAATLAFAGLCLVVFLSFLSAGLWDDGYFFIRYARNAWAHGVMAWNVSDGPVHGMTSQLYQIVVALLHPLAPDHMVTVLKALGAAALAAAAACLFRLRPPAERGAADLALPFAGLGLALVANHVTTGMETLLVFPWLALWARDYLRFSAGGSSAGRMALFAVVTYLLRPDAVLIPLAALLPGLRADRARTLRAYAMALAGLAVCLAAFKLYYGTALPLSFYVKSTVATVHSAEHIAIYADEKVKNALQFLYFAAPFLFIVVAGRSRIGLTLLASAAAFCLYHVFFTVETMGHYSRFYMPAVAPIVAAAIVSWDGFRSRTPAWLMVAATALWAGSYALLKPIDQGSRVAIYVAPAFEIPFVAAMALLLLPLRRVERQLAALAVAVVMAGTLYNYRVRRLDAMDDTAILVKQIAPRKVFLGIVPLTHLQPGHVYHTDMGAPGMLFPDAVVTDLDGLLNEELTIERRSFEEICQRDRPEAIFLPNVAYRALREEVRSSRCFKDYRRVLARDNSPLHVRKDLVERFEAVPRRARVR